MSSETCETVKVVADNQATGYLIINKSDFDKEKHKLFVDKAKPAPATELELTVGRGPGGKFFVKKGKENVAGPFDDEATAVAEKAKLDKPAE